MQEKAAKTFKGNHLAISNVIIQADLNIREYFMQLSGGYIQCPFSFLFLLQVFF